MIYSKISKKKFLKKTYIILREITFGEEKINYLVGDLRLKKYSVTLGNGIHMIDLINWFLILKPKFVTSFAHNKVTKGTNFKKNSFNVSILEYPNKIIAKITSNCAANYQHFHELKIFSKKMKQL